MVAESGLQLAQGVKRAEVTSMDTLPAKEPLEDSFIENILDSMECGFRARQDGGFVNRNWGLVVSR